jgi:hypothetical protein
MTMAREYDNTNTGMLYRNAEKKDAKQRDFSGFLTLKCPHCRKEFEAWLSAWTKEAKKDSKVFKTGQKYFSLAVTPKELRDDDRRDSSRGRSDRPRNDDRREERRDERPAEDDRGDDRVGGSQSSGDIPF